MEAVLSHVRSEHPLAVIDAMCSGPETVARRYGIDTVPMFWFDRHKDRLSGPAASGLKLLSRLFDVLRVMTWVRRHESVIVPGAGVLEASLPLRPWDSPYAFLLLSASGRLFGTRIAFVSVGAGRIQRRATRWFSNWAARLAYYCSYRDAGSREAMRQHAASTLRVRSFPTWPSHCPYRLVIVPAKVIGQRSASASWRIAGRTTIVIRLTRSIRPIPVR